MKSFILTLLVAALGACSDIQIDPSISIYVDEFYHQAAMRNIYPSTKISVQLKSMEEAGKARRERIYINEKVVQAYSSETYSYELEVIVFHELGHAVLNKSHQDDLRGIMNTTPCLNCYKYDSITRARWINDLLDVE